MRTAWKSALDNRIREASRLVVLGVGSELKGDDAAGMLLVERLRAFALPSHVLLLSGSTAPENFIGQIRDFQPDTFLIVDAAYFGAQPGQIMIIPETQISGGGFSTHMLPLTLMLRYLRNLGVPNAILIGIQPFNTDFGFDPCPAVRHAVEELAVFIGERTLGGAEPPEETLGGDPHFQRK